MNWGQYMIARFNIAALIIVMGASVSACGDDAITSADASNERAVEIGEGVYAENCAACHGANLEGESGWQVKKSDGTLPAPPHNDSGHTWHHDDKLLFGYTKLGGAGMLPKNIKSGMPAFGDTLSDEEIWAVLSFIKSKWSIEAQQRQASMNNQ